MNRIYDKFEVIDLNTPKEIEFNGIKRATFFRKYGYLLRYFAVASLIIVISVILFVILYFIVFPVFNTQEFDQCDYKHESYNLTSPSLLGSYSRFAVAVDSQLCSKVGKDILMRDGSAVDAAIASGLCNGLANAQSTGIGGGHFMVIYLKNQKKVYSIDAREQAPLSANEYMFSNTSSLIGGLAAGIPGEIYGYWEAYKIGGRLPWNELFKPVISMCRDGFLIAKPLENAILTNEKEIRNNLMLSSIFINNKTNQTFKYNDKIKMLKLADTLEIISNENITAFYNGSLTPFIIEEINENGGNVTIQDFINYKALIKKPVVVDLDENYRLFTAPLPSSGILVPLIMRIMKGFNLTNETLNDEQDAAVYYHRLIESFKHTFYHRSLLGDENYENMTALVEMLKSEKLVNELRSKIVDSKTFPQSYYGNSAGRNSPGTTHLSVYADGDAVSLTSTINVYFGSKFAGKHTGIIYNNQMDDFSTPNLVNFFGLEPSEANYIKPGKRPLSSMCPIIIIDKNSNVRLILGASGGSKIITAVSQAAIKNVWMNKNIKDSIDERRVHHQLYPQYAEIEIGFNTKIKQSLKQYGHKIKCFNYGGSVLQGIARTNNGLIEANCDARKGGQSEGF